MTVVLMSDEGKRIVVNKDSDVRLYSDGTTNATRGDRLYCHKSRNGNIYYYVYHWTLWQGESNQYELLSKTQAIDYLSGKILSSEEEENIRTYLPEFFEEDA